MKFIKAGNSRLINADKILTIDIERRRLVGTNDYTWFIRAVLENELRDGDIYITSLDISEHQTEEEAIKSLELLRKNYLRY